MVADTNNNRCYHHSDAYAQCYCVRCRTPYCGKCITRVDGKNHCAHCLNEIVHLSTDTRKQRSRKPWLTLVLAVTSAAILLFFLRGIMQS